MRLTVRLVAVPLVAALLAACTGAGASPSAAPTTAPATTAASATAAATPTPNPCSKDQLKTLKAGKLTIGTDNPAYPPYFQPPATGNAPAPWQLGDPTNGRGFESAVAYAVADKLGFAKSDVTWTVVPFDNSYKVGAKPFDFYLAQVSYTPDRAQAVDMSDGYYFVAQSIVALAGSPITKAKSVADLKAFKLGAQRGTTAYDAIQNVIQPTKAPGVYNSNDLAIQAVKAKQVDGIVTDLPTAFFITGSGQLANSVIVGQLPVQQGPNAEHFSLVLAKGSTLTSCVNQAIAALKTDGTLDQLTKKWLSASAPVLQ
ncbi:MAG: ABC transporter substrate-binding protein [Candidatus Limnocylindrales bacterium]